MEDTGCLGNLLDFNGETTDCYQQAGRADAAEALSLDHHRIKDMILEWTDDSELQKEYPMFHNYL
jgi:hypothetical protein